MMMMMMQKKAFLASVLDDAIEELLFKNPQLMMDYARS